MSDRSADDAFLDVVAHELRTPVTTIYAAAYVLAADRLGPGAREALAADLVAESERLYRLVEDLLIFGKATSQIGVDHEPVLFSRIVLDVIEQEQQLLAGHRIVFTGPRDGVAASADEVLVRQVVRDLLDNAVRYTPPGGRVDVVIHETADEVVVRILDGSRHEPTDAAERALEITPDRNSAARRAGAGLRLHIAGRLATAMGGRTWAGPRDGAGTEFGFALPRST